MGSMTIIDLGLCKWLRWNWFNHDQVEWQASTSLGAIYNLKILSGSEIEKAMIKVIKAGLATIIMITIDDYCSVTPGVLQISTTTKNSRPEN